MPRIPSVWWELTKGFPKDLIKDSYIDVSDKPGLGLELVEKAVRKRLPEKRGRILLRNKGKVEQS